MTSFRNPAMSRRDFLRRCGAAGLVAGAGLAGLPARCKPRPRALSPSLKTFVALVDTSFDFAAGSAAVPMRLVSATRLPGRSQSRSVRLEAFSLIFEAPTGSNVAAGIYPVTHPRLGALDLFISPVDRSERRRFEAVFTRLL